jgi:hypothetical protein
MRCRDRCEGADMARLARLIDARDRRAVEIHKGRLDVDDPGFEQINACLTLQNGGRILVDQRDRARNFTGVRVLR